MFNYCPKCGEKLNSQWFYDLIPSKLFSYYKSFKKKSNDDFEFNEENNKEKEEIGIFYIIKANHYYKLGISKNIKKRIKSYTEMPYEIQYIYYKEVNNYKKVELYIMEYFNSKRIKREWFRLNKDDIVWLKKYLGSIEVKTNKKLKDI
jgi:hypothetical protein